MKSAKEWAADKMVFLTTEDCIKAIQTEPYRAGLLRAAQVCRDHMILHGELVDNALWRRAAEAIEAEAQKGGQ